ncbi:MAG TPA: cupin domain-containing protein [Gaiellaceae bacterium]|nr:cupin domain-containing protein [Gaiellaceae bacterium]
MELTSLVTAEPFTTKDGSTIRELHHTAVQSLAEASLPAGSATTRHYHALSEEIYFILDGVAELEIDRETRTVGPGDAALIPPGSWHTIVATTELRLLCCCSPPYSDGDTYFA